MLSNVVMDTKKRYTISADQSVLDGLLKMTQEHGDISLHICSAVAHWLTLPERVRMDMLRRYEQARLNSRYGQNVLTEYRAVENQGETGPDKGLTRQLNEEFDETPGDSTKPAGSSRRRSRRTA